MYVYQSTNIIVSQTTTSTHALLYLPIGIPSIYVYIWIDCRAMNESILKQRKQANQPIKQQNQLIHHQPQPYSYHYVSSSTSTSTSINTLSSNALILSPGTTNLYNSTHAQYQIILQNQFTNRVVLYQPSTKSVVLWPGSNSTNSTLQRSTISTVEDGSDTDTYYNDTRCPTCGHIIDNKNKSNNQQHTREYNSHVLNNMYMSTDYFKLLQYTVDEESNDEQDDDIDNINDTFNISDTLPSTVFNNGYYCKFFREAGLIGRGGYGTCYLTDHILDNELLGRYAIKKIPVGNSRQWLLRVLKEVRALEKVHHANVVAYKHRYVYVCVVVCRINKLY